MTTRNDFIIRTNRLGNAEIVINKPLSYNRKHRYEMVAVATNTGYLNLMGSAIVIINIKDENNHPPRLFPLEYKNTISEAAPVGTTVLKILATDLDTGVGGLIAYTIQDTTVTFVIQKDGYIVSIKPLDYETKQSYTLIVTARDGGGLLAARSAKVYITVSEVNDNQPVFDLMYYRQSVREDSIVGSDILTVTARDSDIIGNTINYHIIPNTDSSSYSVHRNTGVISLLAPLDYEVKKLYTFNVRAEDAGNGSLTGLTHVTIDITDLNDNSPVFVSPVRAHEITVIDSIYVGTLFTVVSATDKDTGINSDITYKITSGNDREKFTLDQNGQIRLIRRLDATKQNKYVLAVTAVDGGQPQRSTLENVIIHVLRFNESTPVFQPSFYNIYIPENTDINITLIALSVAKTMTGSKYNLSFHPSTVFNEFYLNGNNLMLVKELDYEQIPYYDLLILAIDEERDTAMARVRVNVQNLNEHVPQFTKQIFEVSVPELAYIGHSVISLSATDKDEDFILHYRVVGPMPGNYFSMEGNVVRVRNRLVPGTFEFKVMVTDLTFNSRTAKVRILVTSVFSPAFAKPTYIANVHETHSVGQQITRLSAGENKGITYSIESRDARLVFTINSTGM